ncbi:response regulator [Fibrobacterota bacterium]
MAKILIIDDERLIRENLKKLLALEDHEIYTASDGKEGVSQYDEVKPQVVLLDIKMPNMDGIEALKKIKENRHKAEVIMITGHGGVESAIQALQSGAFGYIQKPIDFDALEIEVQRALEKQKLQGKLDVYIAELENAIKEKDEEIIRRQETEDSLKKANISISKLNEDLKGAIKKAEMASQAKSQFLANMSHEIRTPLNSIIGFCKILQETALNLTQKDYVDTIAAGSDLLLSVITDILDVSKIEAGKIVLEEVAFNLESLITSVIKLVSPRMEGRSIRLYHEYDENTGRSFNGDPTRIRQILVNLVNNAIKFTEKGEIKVSVSQEENREKGKLIKCSVKDTGIGISPEKLTTIFSAFDQEDISTTRKYGGTGLGLYIVKNLSQKMGGWVEVFSEKGKGSEFVFYLKLQEIDAVVTSDISPVQARELEGKKLLIVDDTIKNRTIIANYCEDLRMNVLHQASSGKAALDWLDQQQELPEVILSDILMPEMNGKELAVNIKKNQNYKGIKLIALTSNAAPGAAKELDEAGFDAYLPLPVKKAELCRTIQVLLGDKRSDGQIITRYLAEEFTLKGLKILVAEDDKTNQKFVRAMLGNLGCEIDIAINGKEAVNKLKGNPYDVVLMDLQMPVMGGEEATLYIRHHIDREIPILALTASVIPGEKEKCLMAGMNDYLSKPVDPTRLKEAISQWTGRSAKD